MSVSFKPALEDFLDEWKDATADGKVTLHEQLRLAADGCQVLESLIAGITEDAEFEQLVLDAEKLVAEKVVPLDLGKFKVPPMVERFIIDPQLVPMVRPTLVAIRASLVPSPTTDSDKPAGKPNLGGV